MKHIVFITSHYPTKDNPDQAFVQPIARGIVDAGVSCTVICPQSITRWIRYGEKRRPYEWFDETNQGKPVRILQPAFFSFSEKIVAGVSLTNLFYGLAIRRAYQKQPQKTDAIYAHFWNSGIAASFATHGAVPIITASGEQKIALDKDCGPRFWKKHLPGIRGMIAVSTKNRDESRDCGLFQYNPKTTVLLNATDPALFYPMDRMEARKKLGLPLEDTIAVFVGSFEERKGPKRVLEAAKQVPGLKLIFAGIGQDKPQSQQVLFAGAIPHEELVTYLNAADFFVLPTLAEGCCNAIIEAMACGLPVISSNRPFNDDVMTQENSIKIEPTDIDDIAQAMDKLYKDTALRQKLARGALETAAGLRIENRVRNILNFMESVAQETK